MSFFQNPGTGVLSELTTVEELVIQNLAALPYRHGDILYHDGSNLARLPSGQPGQFLRTNGDGNNPSWSKVQPRIVSVVSYAKEVAINIDDGDMFVITGQDGSLLFNQPGGTPSDGERITIRIRDNGIPSILTWDKSFRAVGVALPRTTVTSKTLYLSFLYNSTDSTWDCIFSSQET